jgi:hypothetical protein
MDDHYSLLMFILLLFHLNISLLNDIMPNFKIHYHYHHMLLIHVEIMLLHYLNYSLSYALLLILINIYMDIYFIYKLYK